MRRTRGEDNVGVKPAPSSSETGGYYTDGPPATVLPFDEMNIIQEEIVAVSTLKGDSLDATGANDHQMKDVLEGVVKVVEGANVEAAGVETIWTMAVIASYDVTVGEDSAGVVHCAAIAADACKAKSFESAVIAAGDSQAGSDSGSGQHAATIASDKMKAEGNESAAIASKCADTSQAVVSGEAAASVAVQFTDDALTIAGSASAAVGCVDPNIHANCIGSAIVGGTDGRLLDGSADSALAGGTSNEIAGPASFIGGGNANEVDADHAAIVGGNNNSIRSAGDRSIIAGGDGNVCDRVDSFIAASVNSKIPTGTTSVGLAILASKHCDANQVSSEENYAVMGGYDASTDVPPSWKIESNGGEFYATDTSVNGIDYAELRPNADGAPHAPGRLLTTRNGRGVGLAKPGERVRGVVSVTPTVLGGADSFGWNEMFERDRFGAFVWEEVEEAVDIGPDPAALAEKRRREAAHRGERKALAEALKKTRRRARASSDAWAKAAAEAEGAQAAAEARTRLYDAAVFAFAEAGKLRKLLRGSKLEARVKSAGDSALAAKAIADRATAAATAARAQADADEAARVEAQAVLDKFGPGGPPKPALPEGLTRRQKNEARRAARLAHGPDLSDLDLSPRMTSRKTWQRKINPKWDRARKHVPRTERPAEWTKVGLLGEMRVAVDQSVRAGSFVVARAEGDGIGSHSDAPGPGRPIECTEIVEPFDPKLGYAVAICEVG